MKKVIVSVLLIAVVLSVFMAFAGCVPTDKKYFEKISSYSFWDNEGSQSIAQYKFYDIVDSYLSEGTIENGQCIDKDGKIRKVLYVGWDGVRADAMLNIFHDENSGYGYNYEVEDYSALHQLKKQGGLYLAYAGGEKGQDSAQEASTCPGWTSEFTGGWHDLHGVQTNNDVKKADVDTFIMKYAKLGLNTGLAFEWGELFDLTLKEEIKYWVAHPELPVIYCDTDRKAVSSKAEIVANENRKSEKEVLAESIELYNAVANENVDEELEKYDISMRNYLMDRIEKGDDIVAGIFHSPDSNGHTYEFSNNCGQYVTSIKDANTYVYQLMQVIEEREKTLNEDWLIIVTADHGGSGQGHGKQVYEHRNIWIACNQKLDKYFGEGYDGFKEA